jgi:iron complex transport system ATP-binding protein
MYKVEELSFGYTPNKNNFSATVENGSLTFLIGANGSGKTSLLKTFAGLLSPLSGTVEYVGKVRPLYLPAHPEASDWLTPDDIFEIFGNGSNKQHQQDVVALGVDRILSQPIHHLSLGEQKRVFLAAALASTAETILLDEPLNSLDWNMELVLKRILEQHVSEGRTFLIAAHQLHWIARFKSATSWFLDNFSRLKSGATEEVLLSQEVQSVFNFAVSFTDNPLDGSRLIATGDTKRTT